MLGAGNTYQLGCVRDAAKNSEFGTQRLSAHMMLPNRRPWEDEQRNVAAVVLVLGFVLTALVYLGLHMHTRGSRLAINRQPLD